MHTSHILHPSLPQIFWTFWRKPFLSVLNICEILMQCLLRDALKCAVCTNYCVEIPSPIYCVEQPAVSVQELEQLSLVDRALARAQRTRKMYKNKVSRRQQHSLFLRRQFTCLKGHLSEGYRHSARARVLVRDRARVRIRYSVKFQNLHNCISDKWPLGQVTCRL